MEENLDFVSQYIFKLSHVVASSLKECFALTDGWGLGAFLKCAKVFFTLYSLYIFVMVRGVALNSLD